MKHMDAAYMAEGIVTLAGSKLYTVQLIRKKRLTMCLKGSTGYLKMLA